MMDDGDSDDDDDDAGDSILSQQHTHTPWMESAISRLKLEHHPSKGDSSPTI